MPTWSSGAFKVFRHCSHTERRPTDLSKPRNNSIDIHVHTQRSYFVEPPRTRELYPNPNHYYYLGTPYAPVKIDRKQKPLSISYPLPCLPVVAVQDQELPAGSEDHTDLALAEQNVHTQANKGKQSAESKQTRHHGMQSYPDNVREELRKVRSRSPRHMVAVDGHIPDRVSEGGESSPSVYLDASGYGEEIHVSSACVDFMVFRRGRCEKRSLGRVRRLGPDYLRRILSMVGRGGSTSPEVGPPAKDIMAEPPTANSWSPPRRVPRLPPTDYFLYKEEYDDAAIAQYGALPTEWVQNPNKITGTSKPEVPEDM
ncbi:hypothetical protein FRC10_000507 [Ceratobasidium sp. 414]|nr:hypothetical protein FRC10_000507 [Ceratobasidium sp. 414]